MNLIQKVRATLVYRREMSAKKRGHPSCEVCGSKGTWFGYLFWLLVHHKIPVHVRPDLAADPNNMVVVCKFCHWYVCHLGNFKWWNGNLDETILMIRKSWVDYQKRMLP